MSLHYGKWYEKCKKVWSSEALKYFPLMLSISYLKAICFLDLDFWKRVIASVLCMVDPMKRRAWFPYRHFILYLFPFTKSLLGSHHNDSYTSDYEINKDQVQIHILKHQSNNVNSFLKSLLPSMGFLSVSSTLSVKWLCGNSSPFLLLPVRVCSGCSAGFGFPQVPLRLCSQFCSFWIYFLLHPCI